MVLERTPLQSGPWLQCEKDTRCLQFRMDDGAQPVLQCIRPVTKTDRSAACGSDGEGERWANQVYLTSS